MDEGGEETGEHVNNISKELELDEGGDEEDAKPAAVIVEVDEALDLARLQLPVATIRENLNGGFYTIKESYGKNSNECNRLESINKERYPRVFDADSRPAIAMIKEMPEFTQAVKNLFFKKNGALRSSIKQELATESVGYINFDDPKVKDKRLMFTLCDSKSTFRSLEKLLSESGVVNNEKEDIHDITLLIGGTTDQKLHYDTPRIFGGSSVTSRNHHEVNREQYNNDMKGQWAPASIILDVTSRLCGINLGVPNKLISYPSSLLTTIKCGKSDDLFHVISTGKNGTVINIGGAGVVFAGDFPHYGVCHIDDQDVELTTKMAKLFESLGTSINIASCKILEETTGLNELCRLFLKTKPKQNEFKIYDLNNVGTLGNEDTWNEYPLGN